MVASTRSTNAVSVAATLLLALTFSILAACERQVAPPVPAAAKTTAQRINEATSILKQSVPLSSELIDAQFEELAMGGEDLGAMLGPTDFVSYMYLRVAPADIDKWVAILAHPLDHEPTLEKSDRSYPWWLDQARPAELRFFAPYPLSQRDGWAAVSKKTGEIWIFGFTT